MKIKPSPLIGEASGKLGSVVFSRNAAGPFVRVWVQPVNHRSTAQVNHRALLSTASALWCTIPDEVKTQWHNFAKDPVRFAPVYKMNTGGINGLNAYVAMYIEASKTNILKNNITTIVSTPVGLTHKIVGFSVPLTPPSTPIDNTFLGVPLTVSGSISFNSSTGLYQIQATITPQEGVSHPITVPGNTTIKDGHGNEVGIAIYISTTKKNIPNFSKKMVKKVLATALLENSTANPIDVTSIQITGTYDASNNFTFPQPGDVVDMTFALVGTDGRTRKIGQGSTVIIEI